MKSLTRWFALGIALCVADGIGWIIWHGSRTQATLHELALWTLAFIGFKVAYEIGRQDKQINRMTLRPGRRYHIVGPEGTWVMVGLSTSIEDVGGRAEVTLIDEASYIRRFERPQATRS